MDSCSGLLKQKTIRRVASSVLRYESIQTGFHCVPILSGKYIFVQLTLNDIMDILNGTWSLLKCWLRIHIYFLISESTARRFIS